MTVWPLSFAGYRGESAHRIWKSIYEENCFFKHPNKKALNPFSMESLCFEEKVFYRVISGLHTSINVHLSAMYPLSRGSDHFTHNIAEFLRRFRGMYVLRWYITFLSLSLSFFVRQSARWCNKSRDKTRIYSLGIDNLLTCCLLSRSCLHVSLSLSLNLLPFLPWHNMTGGEKYITNLYFVFLLEMRALTKIESFLVNNVNWQSSGDTSLTRDAIKNVLKVIR